MEVRAYTSPAPMSETPTPSQAETTSNSDRASAHRSEHRSRSRPGAAPPPPGTPRSELAVLSECPATHGAALWRTLSDFVLWSGAPSNQRGGLFSSLPGGGADLLPEPASDVSELAPVFAVLRALWAAPDEFPTSEVARACETVVEWAEASGYKETALQYAEAAACAEPEVSAYAFIAGRICRRAGETERAVIWYGRAARLARLAGRQRGAQIDFANAHLGHGNAFADFGRYDLADPHYWKALRAAREAGRRSLMGMAHHNLLVSALNTDKWEAALGHAERAVSLYKTGHPRFPLLAQDAALLWSRMGFYSSALPVYERVLPFVEHQRERILVLGNLARAAAPSVQ